MAATLSLAQDTCCLLLLAALTSPVAPVTLPIVLIIGSLRTARGIWEIRTGRVRPEDQLWLHRRIRVWGRELFGFLLLGGLQLTSPFKFRNSATKLKQESRLKWYKPRLPRWLLQAPRVRSRGIPVIGVHGLMGNKNHLFFHCARLEQAGRPTYVAKFGSPGQSLDKYAFKLARTICSALAEQKSQFFDLVAHSMGGIVARLCFKQNPALAGKLRTAVTLGSPHYGTPLARLAPPCMKDVRDLKCNAEPLKSLPCLKEQAPKARVVTISAAQDTAVFPMTTCHEASGEIIHMEEHAHTALLTSPKATRLVMDIILEGRGSKKPKAAFI